MWVSCVWVLLLATPPVVVLVGSGLAAVAVGGALITYGAVQVRVRDGVLVAGRGTLPLAYVARVEACDADRTRALIGPHADARAFLVTRGYCRRAVQVWLDDPRDPAPYWLVSTRHAEALAMSLTSQLVRH